jgi:hypothetical protein
MNPSDGWLDAARMTALFQELSDELGARGQTAAMFVVGGAAMALAYDAARLNAGRRRSLQQTQIRSY